ncbi:MAG: divergent polysaccharide deacetylase family protein [Rhodospirillales bacterium]|nr:divergent polysaccharide deacetylase family protein [Rhodospirillales bacterium]
MAEAPTHPPAASETPQRTVSRPPDPPARDPAGPAAAPDAALQEPGPDGAPAPLPRIAADGRQPMQVYAASFDRSTKLPRVAVLVAGMALSEADSLAAARALPPAVSFAISPYGGAIPQVVAALRATRHEFLLSIPMEPQGFPLSDPGDRALMSNLSRADNRARLLWALSRTTGYVGATAALGELRGQRFLGLADQMEPVLADLAGRGLLFVDSRAGEPPLPAVWSRGIDLVLDEPPRSDAIDARLAELEALARSKGAALGLVDVPRPMTVQRLAAWSAGLRERGFVLAPVSAIVQPPPKDVPQ